MLGVCEVLAVAENDGVDDCDGDPDDVEERDGVTEAVRD